MATSTNNNLLGGLDASSSSVAVDYLTLALESMQGIAYLVRSGVQLNGRQCDDLYSKLVKIMENIQSWVPHSRSYNLSFRSAFKNLYKVLEKAKLPVDHCCSIDICRAAVFQILNEETFREILLDVRLCVKVIYELVEHILQDWDRTLIHVEDLCQSSLFSPASESDVLSDQLALKNRLEQLAGTSNDPNQCLARYLLSKLQCIYEYNTKDFGMYNALLWVSATEPQETWKLLHFLGKGSGGVVVSCCTWLDIPCARKEFGVQFEDGFFQREATLLARLNHPNIVKFFCCSNGSKKGQCFIAMELMEMSLDDLIENRRKEGQVFPILVVFDIITQIARGVYYLHGQKIAHRDLKPHNVVVKDLSTPHLEDNFCVKLVDFGMSKIEVQASKSNTISIPGVGTTKYRASEVFPQAQGSGAQGKKKVNWFKADAYSFAITCSQLLSLEEPFQDVPRSALYVELQRGQRPELPQGCPKDLVELLKECWNTNPNRRPSFGDICSRLENCKVQELLGGSLIPLFEGLQRPMNYEYIEKDLAKQFIAESSTIPNRLDVGKDIVLEDAQILHPSNLHYSRVEHKKKIGFWSRTKASFAQFMLKVVFGASHSKRRKLQLEIHWSEIQRQFEEFDAKPHMFSYNELSDATRDFHHYMELGRSNFGVVYKGVLGNGNVVAIKHLYSKHVNGLAEFLNEVGLMTGLKHRNIVTLKGCCLHEQQMFLVYEYVEHFDVGEILLGPRREMVSWPVRVTICLGIARGLHYLHALTQPRVIHLNIKASNVLLDKNLQPKIACFGLGLLFPDEQNDIEAIPIAGTLGYLAPEYLKSGKVSEKVDVFSFGVLCLEIISGRHNFDCSRPLRDWAWCLHKEDNLLGLVDPTLHLTVDEVRDVQRVIKMCLLCIQDVPELRPSMAHVESILQYDMEPQVPKMPVLPDFLEV